MPQLEERQEPTNFVDELSLVQKWKTDDPLQPWWDEYDDTPGVEVWTDLRPLGARRVRDLPGTEKIEQRDTGTFVKEREANAGVVDEPKIKGDWLDIAKSQIGSPYVWADQNPQGAAGGAGAGFDCSGFTTWLYSEAFGVALPAQSTAQAQATTPVSRKQLRPGDLVFFSYGRLGAGVIDHVEIYIGNGKAIGTPDPNDRVGVQPMDWDAFVRGGRVASVAKQTAKAAPVQKPETKRPKGTGETLFDPSLVPASMGTRPDLAQVAGSIMMDIGRDSGRRDRQVPSFSGNTARIKEQLYRGFMDAGEPELARMVRTKDFDIWIKQESGWNPNSVSQFFEGHGRNAGLFQFALGGVNFDTRPWVQRDIRHRGGEWSYAATPYEQARMVVRYFNLTPDDIRRYADQIRAGTYSGWG